VIDHGADGVALSSAILGAPDVESAARSIRQAMDQ
jgi:thiamine monophosphate synthase